jgi:hypothetical protein
MIVIEVRDGVWFRKKWEYNGCDSMYGPEGTKRWILGEDLAWFVHLEEGQREYLERRKETISSM